MILGKKVIITEDRSQDHLKLSKILYSMITTENESIFAEFLDTLSKINKGTIMKNFKNFIFWRFKIIVSKTWPKVRQILMSETIKTGSHFIFDLMNFIICGKFSFLKLAFRQNRFLWSSPFKLQAFLSIVECYKNLKTNRLAPAS